MSFTTITDPELVNMGVTGLDDTPELSTEAMQEQFDEYPRFLKDKFKTHIIEEEANTAASNIGAKIPTELDNVTEEKIQPILDELATRIKNQKDWQDAADQNFHPAQLNTGAFHADAESVTVPTAETSDISNKAASTEFVDNKMQAIGAGDMAKSVYDPHVRGVVETAYNVANSIVSEIGTSTADYPVPAPGDAVKNAMGKIIKYLSDLKTTLATALHDGMMSKEDKAKLDAIAENAQAPAYGTCSTAASTADKVVTTDADWKLRAGALINVRFSNTNTASSPTLNVNNTGAKSIVYGGSVVYNSDLYYGGKYGTILYMYDGTNYVFVSWGTTDKDRVDKLINEETSHTQYKAAYGGSNLLRNDLTSFTSPDGVVYTIDDNGVISISGSQKIATESYVINSKKRIRLEPGISYKFNGYYDGDAGIVQIEFSIYSEDTNTCVQTITPFEGAENVYTTPTTASYYTVVATLKMLDHRASKTAVIYPYIEVNGLNQFTRYSKSNFELTEVSDNVQDFGDDYDPTHAYSVGELCIYDNKLYECNTACSAAAWSTNSGYFTRKTLTAVASTLKDALNYSLSETDTGAKWIDGKTIYRKVIDFGALPDTGNKSVAHGISSYDTVIKLNAMTYNSGNDTKQWQPIPAANSTLVYSMAIWIDKTNVTIKTGDNRTHQTPTYVIIEYTK